MAEEVAQAEPVRHEIKTVTLRFTMEEWAQIMSSLELVLTQKTSPIACQFFYGALQQAFYQGTMSTIISYQISSEHTQGGRVRPAGPMFYEPHGPHLDEDA